MPALPLRQLGMEGLQRDVSAHDVPANGLIRAQNVRIKDRAIQAFSDVSESIIVSANESLLFADGIFRDRQRGLISGIIVVLADELLGAFDDGFDVGFAVAGQIVVYFYDTDGARTDISPTVPFTEFTEEWFGHKAGVFYILTNASQIDLPHTWVHTEDPIIIMTPMPGWPVNYTCRFMVSYKNFLVAGGLTIDGEPSAGIVKWSHPVSIGDTTTFWDFTDPTILAGENPIVDNVREMRALHQLKDLLMIYFDQTVWRMTFVGGQSVFTFEKAFDDDGCVSARSMVEVEARAYVFGLNDVYSHDGFSKQSVTDLRLTRHIESTVDPGQRVDVTYYPFNNEILFLGRTPGLESTVDGDVVFIYNLPHDAWTQGDVTQNNDGAIALYFIGPNITSGVGAQTWDVVAETWDSIGQAIWSGSFDNPERETLYALSLQEDVIWDFDASFGENIFRTKALLSHTKIDLDESGMAVGDRVVYLNRVYPQITGAGSVNFRFGVSKTANSPVNWVESCVFKISKEDVNDPDEEAEDYACDVRLAGRYLAYEMTPIDGAFFTISGMDLEIDIGGEV